MVTNIPCVFLNASQRLIIDLIQYHHDMIQDTGACIILTLTLTLFISCLVRVCPRTEAKWVRWEPGGHYLIVDYISGWPCPAGDLLSSCPLLSLSLSLSAARSVTSYKSNNKNAVTAISATHGQTVNLSLLVLRETNKPLFIKQRNILAWKYFFKNNPPSLFCPSQC